jgi:archaeal flagellin FlaB
MQKKYMNENENELGSIGIGAMIVFIALILVAAVASAVIIQTGEKLQQNAQQTGTDTQQEIGGKISIITSWVGDQSDCDGTGATNTCVTVVFELAPGSEPLTESQITWTIICDDGAVAPAMQTVFGTFNNANTLLDTRTADGVRNDAADGTLNPGVVYMIDLPTDANDVALDECSPTINEQHTLIISVEAGGSTYETLSYTSETQGDSVV